MKVSVIFPSGIMAAWSVTGAIPETLTRMGHKPIGFPRAEHQPFRVLPEILEACDLIIVSGGEHILRPEHSPCTMGGISLAKWKQIKTPKAVWYHESFFRDDVTFDFGFLSPLFDYHFFPARQDAKMFGAKTFGREGRCFWLPSCADTTIFNAGKCGKCKGRGYTDLALTDCKSCEGTGQLSGANKEIPCAFIGSMYGPRANFVDRLAPHVKGASVIFGNCLVQRVEGVLIKESAELMADDYRRIQVFLNLPSLSRMLVTKVYEAMACGVLMLTPAIEGDAQENMDIFQMGEHLLYYRVSNLPFLAQMIRDTVHDPARCAVIAKKGQQEVLAHHSTEKRIDKMLREIGGGK
jgi:Glycosyl transferases group 1